MGEGEEEEIGFGFQSSEEGRMYTVDWVGTVALGVLEDGKPRFALALEENQVVPAEFKIRDELRIVNHPADPASVAMGMNYGYYEVTHVKSGTVLRIMHRVYEYMFR